MEPPTGFYKDRCEAVILYSFFSDMGYNFNKYSHGEADTLNYPYDYNSVMHYEKYAFSRNGRATILAKGNSNIQLGQNRGFSQIDIKQINVLYQCQSGKINTMLFLFHSYSKPGQVLP